MIFFNKEAYFVDYMYITVFMKIVVSKSVKIIISIVM